MVRYYFICEYHHTFDAWFKNIEFFEEQVKVKGNIICPICGSDKISRQLIAPSIIKGSSKSKKESKKGYSTDIQKINDYIQQFHKYVKDNFSYVGTNFKDIAIKMHNKEIEKSNIYGEVDQEGLTELEEKGINVFSIGLKDTSNKIN